MGKSPAVQEDGQNITFMLDTRKYSPATKKRIDKKKTQTLNLKFELIHRMLKSISQ